MKKKPIKSQQDLADELFGNPADLEDGISTGAIDDAVDEAASWGGLGFQVDPEIADEICAELVSEADLEKIQP